MPRDGSFALASFGSVRNVQVTAFAAFGRRSVAMKRILLSVIFVPFRSGCFKTVEYDSNRVDFAGITPLEWCATSTCSRVAAEFADLDHVAVARALARDGHGGIVVVG